MNASARSLNRVDALVRRLADDIQADLIGHGAWLKQLDLAERYDVNRLTVRSALDKLVARGLVEHEPNRGYKVRSVDGTERQELLEIRAVLERTAAPGIVENAGSNDIAELRRFAEDFSIIASRSGEFLALVDANLQFHQKLLSLSSNRQIPILVAEIRGRMARGQNPKWKSISRLEQSALEHHRMIDAIEARNADQLEQLVFKHITTT